MADYLKRIDRVGKEFKFNIDGQESFKTSVGGIISLFYYIGLIALFFYFGRDLYQKNDPNFITRVDILNEYMYSEINNDNFFIAFSISNGQAFIYNLSYFDIVLDYISYNMSSLNGNANRTITNSQKCNQEVNKKIIPLIESENYCFNNLNHKICGFWTAEAMFAPIFKIIRCNNETEDKYNIKCASDEEVETTFKELFLFVYYSNNLINPQNFDFPYKQILLNKVQSVNLAKKRIFQL